MKIYINRKPTIGPWGGGNKTLTALCKAIVSQGHKLVFELEQDIDVIFCYDPRPDQRGVWYKHFVNYKHNNPNTIIIQRVGDVGTHSKPDLTQLLKDIIVADYTDLFIFPSNWARDYLGHERDNFKIIKNKPLDIFYDKRINSKIGKKIKIVTHHWSTNEKKGFDFYNEIGIYSKLGKISNKDFELTYIGRYNKDFSHEGWQLIEPVSEIILSEMLPKYDLYLTASVEEAGANHVLEAMAAGLPIVYHDQGGSINEYCKDYGLSYNSVNTFIQSAETIIDNFSKFKSNVLMYDEKINTSIIEYIKCIENGESHA
jgi:hypothetical protein